MKNIQIPRKTYLSAVIGALLASSGVNAGGFSLYTEGAGYTIGNYAAGAAAEVADASTGWYNPAGLAFLGKQQVVTSGVGVFPTTKLTGNSTYSTTLPGIPNPVQYTQNFSELNGAENGFVPSFHIAVPLNDRVAFGLSVVSPFGLSTNYSTKDPVRYAATFSELLTVNISPEFGAKITDNFAIGAGIDWQWTRVKFNRMIGSPALLQAIGAAPTTWDSLSYNKGDSTGIGFHAGVLAAFNDNHTRVGLNYQSKVKHRFRGFSELRGPLADPAVVNGRAVFRSDGLFSNEIEFPDVLTLSGYHDVNDKLAVLGSVVYTGWDVFKTIELNNVAAAAAGVGPVVVNSTATQNYDNAWRFALGANYKFNEEWMLRVGGGYDQTPTINQERDVRLPDADRWALSIGSHYQMNHAIGFDIGYTYLFANKDTRLNKVDEIGTTSTYNIQARTKPYAHLVGLQAVWTMDDEVVVTK